MSYNLVNPTTGALTKVSGNINSNIIPSNASADNKLVTESELSYSTSETKTGGTWTDGKPIYRKVFTGLNYGSDTTWGSTGATMLDIDTLINGLSMRSSDNTVIRFVGYRYRNNIIEGYFDNFAGCDKLIIEYTKTTD